FFTHGICPWFCTENTDFQRALTRIKTLTTEFIENREHVARCHHDDARTEVIDQGYLTLGLTAGHRNNRTAQALRTVMRADTTGKQAITISIMQHIAGTAATGTDGTGNQIRPVINVGL